MNFNILNRPLTFISPSSWPTPSNYLAKKFSEGLFPGTFNKLRTSELDQKLDNRDPGYIPLREYTTASITTPIGTTVHTYILKAPDKKDGIPADIIIFHHGNIRPPKYLCSFLETLAGKAEGQRMRTVVAPNFVGYDGSSPLISEDEGALEITVWENSLAVCKWVKENLAAQDNVQIIVAGRSIGTFSTVAALSLPYIKKAILFVPIDSLPSLIRKAFPPIGLISGFPEHIVKKAFPSGKTHNSKEVSDYKTNSFDVVQRLQTLSDQRKLANKLLQIFSATKDEWVPETAAQKIKAAFGGNAVAVIEVEGDHRALPGDEKNPQSLTALYAFMASLADSQNNSIEDEETNLFLSQNLV